MPIPAIIGQECSLSDVLPPWVASDLSCSPTQSRFPRPPGNSLHHRVCNFNIAPLTCEGNCYSSGMLLLDPTVSFRLESRFFSCQDYSTYISHGTLTSWDAHHVRRQGMP